MTLRERPEGSHDVAKVVASETFRFVNLRIDAKAAEILTTMGYLEKLLGLAASAGGRAGPVDTLAVRTSYETGDNEGALVALPYGVKALRRVADAVAEIERLEAEVRELQDLKLELLADPDYLHGGNGFQLAVFGPVEIEAEG